MKIKQGDNKFQPITITLETEEEALNFAIMLKNVNDRDSSKCGQIDCGIYLMLPNSIIDQL